MGLNTGTLDPSTLFFGILCIVAALLLPYLLRRYLPVPPATITPNSTNDTRTQPKVDPIEAARIERNRLQSLINFDLREEFYDRAKSFGLDTAEMNKRWLPVAETFEAARKHLAETGKLIEANDILKSGADCAQSLIDGLKSVSEQIARGPWDHIAVTAGKAV